MQVLRDIIDQYKDIPLSDKDIRDMMNEGLIKKFNVISYSELKNYNNIDQVLGPENICFILYEWKPHYGHWCLLQRSGNLIEFFDPYGKFPDSQLEEIEEPFRTGSGQKEKTLSKLLLDSDNELSYNQYPFQHLGNGVKTCGKWCVMRAFLKDLKLDEFQDLFLGVYSDDLVTFLTLKL